MCSFPADPAKEPESPVADPLRPDRTARVRRLAPNRAGAVVASLGPAGLRLVGDEEAARRAPASRDAVARALDRAREVREANEQAARLDPADARDLLAARTAGALEGGRAAVLRPERRREIVGDAARLGLRAFDANLIIAIVQDGARRGEAHDDPGAAARLRLVRPPAGEPRSSLLPVRALSAELGALVWALALGGALALVMIGLLLRG